MLSNHVKNKPCQTPMVAGDVEFVFASRNERFKQIEIKIKFGITMNKGNYA